MKLIIKNMVCDRCIAAVKTILADAGYTPLSVNMGEVELATSLLAIQLEKLDQLLQLQGFELLDDKKSKLIEQIKTIIIRQIHHQEELPKFNFSKLLIEQLHKDYSTLSNLFSETQGLTIEQYIILQKIERVKELLSYDELSLSQIADKMGYSSVAHLSTQFKKITEVTPSQFKALKENQRKALDKITRPK